MSFTLSAVNVPAPVCPATFINPTAGTPVVAQALLAGDTTALLSKFNENAARMDSLGRYGGGCYAVVTGLAISAGAGLTLNVAAGQAVMDSPVTLPSGGTIALPDATTRLYIWLSQAGALSYVANSLTPPAGAQVYLGSAVTSGGAITSVDLSGVLQFCAGTLCRNTADTSCPTDSPGAVVLLNIGTGGTWLWTGAKYVCLAGGRAALTFSSDANKTLSTPEATNSLIDLTSGGTALTATRNVVLPLEAGREWMIRNNSNGGQSIQAIGATGTGVTIATGKSAVVACDGTNVFRVTPDT